MAPDQRAAMVAAARGPAPAAGRTPLVVPAAVIAADVGVKAAPARPRLPASPTATASPAPTASPAVVAAVTPAPAEPAAESLPVSDQSIELILARGEASSLRRVRVLAGRARSAIEDLRRAVEADVRETKARDRVADLRRALDEAEALLRQIRGGETLVDSPDPRVVRAWARENNIAVPTAGRVPQWAVDQWRKATTGGEVDA